MSRQAPPEIPFFWVSAKAYSEQTGLGYEETLRQCKTGGLTAAKTDGEQWRVKVYKYEAVPREEYERVISRLTMMEERFKTILSMAEV